MVQEGESQAKHRENLSRVAFYIDAFNLYYAIHNLDQQHLKWINLWELASSLLSKRQQQLVKVVFCSAYNKADFDRLARHQKFVRAIEHFGVTCVMGHFIREPRECRQCGHSWDEASEKQTDVNVALQLFHDAHADAYDEAYLVTADSDQAATARMLKAIFPQKRLVSVVPPERFPSNNILSFADAHIVLTVDHLEKCVMPQAIMGKDEKGRDCVIVKRPDQYAPPQGWKHPRAG